MKEPIVKNKWDFYLQKRDNPQKHTHTHINLHECQDKSDISCHSFTHIVSDFLSLLLCIVILQCLALFHCIFSILQFFPSIPDSHPVFLSYPPLLYSLIHPAILPSSPTDCSLHSACVCVCVWRERVGGWESFLLSQSTVLLLTLACYLQTVFSLAAVPICRREGGYTDVAAAMFTYGKVIKFEENWMLKHCWLHEEKNWNWNRSGLLTYMVIGHMNKLQQLKKKSCSNLVEKSFTIILSRVRIFVLRGFGVDSLLLPF